jgi:hypothetical protein
VVSGVWVGDYAALGAYIPGSCVTNQLSLNGSSGPNAVVSASTNIATQPAMLFGFSLDTSYPGASPSAGTSPTVFSGRTISWPSGLYSLPEDTLITDTGAAVATWGTTGSYDSFLGVAIAFTQSSGSSSSSGGSSSSGSGSANPASGTTLGMNLAPVNYYSPEMPFLNIVKGAGDSTSCATCKAWATSNATASDTNEEAYLQSVLDSDGYPTSLSVAGIPGGQQFTQVCALVDRNLTSIGGAYPYPSGSYTVTFSGSGTIQISGDASATINASGGTFAVTNPTSSGLNICLTATGSGANYLTNLAVVQTAYQSAYASGSIFNPAFLAEIANIKNLRFMDWNNTNQEFTSYTAAGTISAGATSATLSSNWANPTGTYPIVFVDGEQRMASFTYNSSTFSWSGALTNSVTTLFNGIQFYSTFWLSNDSFANRTKPSNAFWTDIRGVPLEVQIALCNLQGAACYINVPLSASTSDVQSIAALVMQGTGMQAGYSGLSTSLPAYFERSNEVWNGDFQQFYVAIVLGQAMWPTQSCGTNNFFECNRSYYGYEVQSMANSIYTQLGSTTFSRAIPVLGAEADGTFSATDALACAFYANAPCTSNVKAIAIAPYWGGNPSQADVTTMLSQADGGLTCFFESLTTNATYACGTLSSVPADGWLGKAEDNISAYASIMPNYPGMSLVAYEGGQNFLIGSAPAGWGALAEAAQTDSRMGTAYTQYINFWKSHVGTTTDPLWVYNDVSPLGPLDWGLIQSSMQSPLTSVPKWSAVQGDL